MHHRQSQTVVPRYRCQGVQRDRLASKRYAREVWRQIKGNHLSSIDVDAFMVEKNTYEHGANVVAGRGEWWSWWGPGADMGPLIR